MLALGQRKPRRAIKNEEAVPDFHVYGESEELGEVARHVLRR
jgi:hypothetical protein